MKTLPKTFALLSCIILLIPSLSVLAQNQSLYLNGRAPSAEFAFPINMPIRFDNFKNTRWQMARSTGYVKVDLIPIPNFLGDPRLYKYAQMPFPNDPTWINAPTKDGKLNFDVASRLPGGYRAGCFKNVDFTYFRTYVNIPEGVNITQFRVTIAQVDDGARMYLTNNSNVGGTYMAADDAKLSGNQVSADFTNNATTGWNMVCIVQFDNCPNLNKLTGGVEIKINNQIVVTDTNLTIPNVAFAPKKFKLETYGVGGQGRTGETYWIGWNSKQNKSGIITNKEDADTDSYIFEVERVEVANGVALKVLNYQKGDPSKSYYLPDLQTSPYAYAVKPPLEDERDLTKDHKSDFISFESVSTPDSYLRHSGFVLYNQRGDKSAAFYRQDCTWQFHEILSK